MVWNTLETFIDFSEHIFFYTHQIGEQEDMFREHLRSLVALTILHQA